MARPAVSDNNTVISQPGQSIVDRHGNAWSIVGGQVAVNGVVDPRTANVILLAYVNGRIWQENTADLWWSKVTPNGAWTPTFGRVRSPLHRVASAEDSVIVTGTASVITDRSGNTWSIVNGQVAVNGTIDPTTNRVIALTYAGGKIWQENADRLWWSKSKPADAWNPPFGTATGPVAIATHTWIGPADGNYGDPANWTSGLPKAGDTINLMSGPQIISISDTVVDNVFITSATETNTSALDVGPEVRFNANIRSVFGELKVNLLANVVSYNAGTFDASSSIGVGSIAFNIAAGATFLNYGTISTSAGLAPLYGNIGINVASGGHFDNAGLIDIRGGALSVTFDHDLSNRGRLVVEGSGSATVKIGTTYGVGSVFNNAGLVEADGTSNILFQGLAAFETRYGSVANSGLIHANGGSITIDGALAQTGAGRVEIDNGGTLTLDRACTGGTITITSGMLNFGGSGRAGPQPYGAAGFASTLIFTALSGQIGFNGQDVTEMFKATAPNAGELLVYLANGGPYTNQLLADIHLSGAYAASDFSVNGSVITYLSHSV